MTCCSSTNGADLEATINNCKSTPTKNCRNTKIRVVKAHVDATKLVQVKDRDLADKAFSLLILGRTVGSTRSSETANDDIATGLASITDIRAGFEIGKGKRWAAQDNVELPTIDSRCIYLTLRSFV